MDAVTALPLRTNHSTQLTTFTALDGVRLGIRVDSVALPLINDKPVELRPSRLPLYDGAPHLQAKGGDQVFLVRAAGLRLDGQDVKDAVLDFSGSWR